ncbi:MAG: YifB family Mg chelatase-like AAA ATPase [Eubacteriales bacterium]|nr:YifB family Mg chelatase-like AAA ATPase [Eubacteriales bacterium]
MYSTVMTGAVHGVKSYLLRVETNISEGLPGFSMVGFMSGEVRESGERVRVALRNAGITIPAARITVNLAPADIPKRGIVIDLPVAVGELICMGLLRQEDFEDVLVAGELGLNGEIRPVRGILPIAQMARESGIKTCILPQENQGEGAVVDGIRVVGVRSINELMMYMETDPEQRDAVLAPAHVDVDALFSGADAAKEADFSDVRGQAVVKKGMEIAAAGFHNLLMIGPPGTGKSMLAKCMPGIMPPLTFEESMEVSAVYSVAGALPEGTPLVVRRPFLAPHHSITRAALVGGGMVPMPGQISLAHRGVLFLDELPEFGREQLDLLRQPLEDHEVTIVRQSGGYKYPARFVLLGACNPCPCGHYPDRNRCKCTPWEVKRYLARISGPLLDRMDLCMTVPRARIDELQGTRGQEESSSVVRERVMEACARQAHRFRGTNLRFNADMRPPDLERYCRLGTKEQGLLRELFEQSGMSVRAYHRIIRVARTVADLEGREEIRETHLYLAYTYRQSQILQGGE